jgi:protein-S-isoprenylcysteine O-methyltransferase Ste14
MGTNWVDAIVVGSKVIVAWFWEGPSNPSGFFFPIACDLWMLLWLYWLVCAFKSTAVKAKEPFLRRLSHIIPVATGLALLFSSRAHYSWFGIRFAPDSNVVAVTGTVLTAAGVALAMWARFALGQNWSAAVIIRKGHQLVRKGPYRTMRHPIYTGILLGLLGTLLVVGELRGLLGFAIILAGFYGKARKEERWLAREFGEKLQVHLKQTGMFLPRFSWPAFLTTHEMAEKEQNLAANVE